MYKIKQVPEDFIVIEQNDFNLDEKGKYALVLMEKREFNTVKAISIIAKRFNLKMNEIGFAGNKDRNAITFQYISLYNISKKRIEEFENKDLKLTYKGQLDDRINLGNLIGNKFEIVVRNLDTNFKLNISELDKIPNYFGEQRFSTNNIEIGKAILKDNFSKVIDLILESKGENEIKIKEFIDNNKNNYVGAFKILPKKIQQIYVHAFQSYLWNLAVKKYLKQKTNDDPNNYFKKIKNIDFPVIGFDTDFEDDEIEEIYDDILEKEEINFRDFIIRKLSYLTCEGSTRKLFLNIKNFKNSNLEQDELNSTRKNKKKIKIEFILGKGSYATTLIKYLFS